MNVPAVVQGVLDDEEVVASVSLTGEDAMYVTPSRTLVYRGEGLLSDESVEQYPHGAERVVVEERRRKASVHLDYGTAGERSFAVPAQDVDAALHPVLAGLLNERGITEAGETVVRTFRFSELTVVVTSQRLLKHVGAAVWDPDYDEVHYDDVTGLALEEGSHASQVVLETQGHTMRFKAPNDRAREVHERLEEALLAHHGAASYEEFAGRAGEEGAAPDEAETDADPADSFINSELDPIQTPGESATGPDHGSDLGTGLDDADPGHGAGAGGTDEDGPTDGGAGQSGESDGDGARTAEGDTTDAEVEGGTDDPGPSDGTADTGTEGGTAGDGAEGGTADAGDEAGTADEFEDSAFESAVARGEFANRRRIEEDVRDLYRAVERQQELLARQQAVIEDLARELGRERAADEDDPAAAED